jgi:hypothetical protein
MGASMWRLAFIAFGLLSFTTGGCTGRDGARDAGDSARGMVKVDLSYTHTVGAPQAEVHFDAQARFVRYRAFDPASVPTILGFADFDAVPLDGCKVSDGTAELDEALAADGVGPAAEVALLDAGRLDVRGPVDRGTLGPRHYPELVPFVSGVVYGDEETAPVSLGLGQLYQVSGEGGAEVGAFSAQVTAPRAFPSLVERTLVLRHGDDLDLRWSTEAPAATEPLLVEVKWTSRTGTRAIRCRARDDGFFSVPHDAFDGLPPATALSSFTVTATRLARGPLAAPGAGRGELTVALKDTAALQVAP